ncbi:MAG: hypothetical protein OJF50_001274 [Nitrospira sp.]|jgi:hypothetical protein|nr:hypothetical protein [Nitrospira sp.]
MLFCGQRAAKLLEEEESEVMDSRFSSTVGHLVLFRSSNPDLKKENAHSTLGSFDVQKKLYSLVRCVFSDRSRLSECR